MKITYQYAEDKVAEVSFTKTPVLIAGYLLGVWLTAGIISSGSVSCAKYLETDRPWRMEKCETDYMLGAMFGSAVWPVYWFYRTATGVFN